MKTARGKPIRLRPEDLTPDVLQFARRAAARAAKLMGPDAYWVVERMEEIWARRGPQREKSMLARIDAILAEASPVRIDAPTDAAKATPSKRGRR